MKNWLTLTIVACTWPVFAQGPSTSDQKATPPPANALTLEKYLEQVKAQNPEAKGYVEAVTQAKYSLDEAQFALTPEFYTNYDYIDDRTEPPISFSGNRTKRIGFKSGVKDTTKFGLQTDVYFSSYHSQAIGVPDLGSFIPIDTEYRDTHAGVMLTQNLWRNGFGGFTKATFDMQRSMSRKALLGAQYSLKQLLLKAENTYWNMVSLNQIVKLQEENVDRAKRLGDWMRRQVGRRLADDVDGLQAQASLETRDLELQVSLDDRATLSRQFNTIRGSMMDAVEPLAELPTEENIMKTTQDTSKRMTREDFRMIYEQAQADQARARGADSQIAPQLDLKLGVATNGHDVVNSRAYDEITRANNPMWSVGVMFSIPLDYSLIGDLKRSYGAAKRAAKANEENAIFAEDRAWHDLQLQKGEAQKRFARAVSLEKVQTELVKRERNRLMNGRTTTFQAITFEQNLALAQIQKVRSQLDLLQIFNVLKTWEGQQ